MGHKDIISKTTIKQIMLDLANILLKLDISQAHLELLETEQQRVEDRRADILARVQSQQTGEPYILHIEIQNNNHPQMPLRMLRYYTDIALQWKNEPIQQYLIYIGKQKLRMPDHIDQAQLHYHYPIFDMRNLDCQQLLKQDTPDALVLAILCDFKSHSAQEVIQHILKRLKSLLGDDEKEFRRYINMLEVLSENRDLTHAVKEAEKMLSDIDITRLPSYEIGLESGIEKGDRQRQLNIAKKMLGKLSDQEIALFTDLSLPEIKQLKQDKAS